MIPSDQTTYNYAEYFNERLPEDQIEYEVSALSGLSDLQMKGIYDGTEGSLADISTDVFNHITLSRTESTADLFQVKSCDSLIELAGLRCSSQCGSPGIETLDTPVWNHWITEEETVPSMTYMNMGGPESQVVPTYLSSKGHTFQQAVNMNIANDFQPKLKGSAAACGLSAMAFKSMPKRSRDRSREANLRYTVNERLQALRELLPASFKNSRRDAVVDNAMSHIKQLELQLKVLSASKLGGEPISTPLIYIEGHGHYCPQDHMMESVEEVIGNLIEENPTAAWKLLESKGLYMMPIASVDALHEAE